MGQLTELLIDAHGVGEFTLLLPALVRLAGQQSEQGEALKWITLVSVPYLPYAPALACSGLDLSRLLVVRSRQGMDALWAIEQALHSRTCAAVVGWSETADERPLRRLQLATEAGGSWLVLFRPSQLRSTQSPAPLRVHLEWERAGSRLVLNILKRRGGPPATISVDIGR